MRKQTKLVAVLSAAALLAIGASMTSFAATRGWVQEGEDWVYLDNDGERVYNQWKRSGSQYYWLGEEGLMVRDSLIYDDTVGAYYYVDENGARVMNAWKSVPNEEGVTFGESQTTPSTLYYYFGSTGKATRSDGTINDVKVTSVSISGGKYFGFDTEGRMVSGWQNIPDSKGELQLYYFGTEDEGWAYTGWQYLEPDENLCAENYDDAKWFYFEPNGKAVKGKSKYIGNRYYAFNEDGVMESDWYKISTNPTVANASQTLNGSTSPVAYASSNGTLSSGWVYDTAMDEDDLDPHWFYLVSINGTDNKVKRSVPYNYSAGDVVNWVKNTANGKDEWLRVGPRAKVIKNKTYFFDTDGKMLAGFVSVGDSGEARAWAAAEAGSSTGAATTGQAFDDGAISSDFRYFNIPGRTLTDGLYYFNKSDDPGSNSTEGQMQTGRTAVTVDGEVYYFYFDKTSSNTNPNYGRALVNSVKDGYLYGPDGSCITAEDGNAYGAYVLREPVTIVGSKKIDGDTTIDAGTLVIIGRTGRIKQNGTVTIDGIKYEVSKYAAKEVKQDQ